MPSILVVDDDRAVQQMLVDLLGERGYEVHTCRDGAQVMMMLGVRLYDLLILDVLVPHENGFTIIEKVRADLRLRELPVVMISGIYRGRNHKSEMQSHFGVLDYFDKPLALEPFIKAIEAAVGPGRSSAARRSTAPLAAADGEVDAVGGPAARRSNEASGRRSGLASGGRGAWEVNVVGRPPSKAREDALDEGDGLIDAEARKEQRQVEAESRSGFRASAFVLQGSLKNVPVAALLGRLWNEGVSGALLLRQDKAKKIVYLRGGSAYAVRSNLVQECLGRLLLQERLINEAQCQESIRLMQEANRRQGELLVEMHALTDKNLAYALELQLETKLFSPFAWENGEYRFNASAPLPAADVEIEWKGPALIVEGIRRSFDETRLRGQMLAILDVPLGWRQPELDIAKLRLGEREDRAVNRLKLPQTTRQLLESMGLEPPEALRVVYSLIALQLLTPAG